MKKRVLGLLYLAALSAVFAVCTCWTGGGTARAAAREVSARTDTPFRIDLAGPWHLDSEKNDLSVFPDRFPAYEEFGAGMEIKSDGQISWYIGTEGGAGTYTQGGDMLTADIATDAGRQQITVPLHMIPDGETVQLEMKYNEVTVYWIYDAYREAFIWNKGGRQQFQKIYRYLVMNLL